MKKKCLALIMAGVMALSFTGCGSEKEAEQAVSDSSVKDALEQYKEEKSKTNDKDDKQDSKEDDEEEKKTQDNVSDDSDLGSYFNSNTEDDKDDEEDREEHKEDESDKEDEDLDKEEKDEDDDSDEDEKDEEENDESSDTSDNPLCEYEMTINGETLQLPMWFSDMEEAGWKYDGDSSEKMSAYSAEGWHVWEKDGIELTTTITNFSVNTAPYEECIITKLDYSIHGNSDKDDIELPGGIKLHESTFDEMVEVYGEPERTYQGEDSDFYFAYYEFDYDHGAVFIFDLETDIVRDAEIECEEELDGVNNEVNDERPEILDTYEEPSELSDDPYDATLELDGVVYQLPCPVEKFIENGWELEEGDEQILSSASYDYYTLVKDDMSLDTVLRCPTKDAVYSKYGYVTRIGMSAYSGEEYPFSLYGDITMGEEITPEEIEKLYSDMEVDADLSDDDMKFFHINPTDDDSEVSYYIVINDGVVGGIEVENNVRFER